MNELKISEDGSHTLYSSRFGVTYHSKYGSLQEADTVFINAGLKDKLQDHSYDELRILEMGLGSGLNAIMTLVNVPSENVNITYDAIEAYPIDQDTVIALNYPEVLGLRQEQSEAFLKMHEVESDSQEDIYPNFRFQKFIRKIEESSLAEDYYDVIYYDAFGPAAQSELWTADIMNRLYHATRIGGYLVTYCAQGAFKRALKSAGYQVEALPGPIGKREMTRAIKL